MLMGSGPLLPKAHLAAFLRDCSSRVSRPHFT